VSGLWPIELFHPDGEAEHRLLLGGGRSLAFGPGGSVRPGGSVQVVVIAPTSGECREVAFLEAAVAALAHRLAGDGLGYILAPRRWRVRLLRQLDSAQWDAGPAFAHFSPATGCESVIPFGARQLRTAMLGPPGRSMRQHVARRTAPILRTLRRGLPMVGMLVRPKGARACLEWLGHPKVQPDQVILRVRWGKKGGRSTLECLTWGDGEPALIGKIALDGGAASGTVVEAAALERFGPDARRAGARVPQGTLVWTGAGRPLLLAERLPGRPAMDLLRERSIGAPEVIARLGGWLERWNRTTRGSARTTIGRLGARLLEEAEPFAPLMPAGGAYLEWIRARLAETPEFDVPLVAAHKDLTMANVLLEEGLAPGIIDWEAAGADGLPLTDFCYAAVDATAASLRGCTREEAFAKCFLEDTADAEAVRRWNASIQAASGLAPELVPLCFHACWLHHAANEARTPSGDGRRPFLAILRRLAADPAAARVR
jgi:hypothetical protein